MDAFIPYLKIKIHIQFIFKEFDNIYMYINYAIMVIE
jgi:hypothetical protein